MSVLRVKITQYGLSKKAHGWDGVGDSGTDAWLGNHGNKLIDGFSCALTERAQELLGCVAGALILITFDDGTTQVRRFDDRAPEADARLDMFNAYRMRPQGSDYAEVSLLHV